jgi:glycosyltransferase involved in cell wall biosynthesis
MTILVSTSSFPRFDGDLNGNFVFELTRRLKQDENDILVLCPHSYGSKLIDNCDNIKIYRFPYFFPLRLQRLCSDGGMLYNYRNSILAKIQLPLLMISEMVSVIVLIATHDVRVIHSHWLIPQGIIGAICKKLFGTRHIISVHGSDINYIASSRFLWFFFEFITRNTDIITTNSTYTKSRVLQINDSVSNKIHVIPMGVDTEKFNISNRNPLETNLDAECIILTAGRLVSIKGINYLIQSMPQILERFPKAKLVICGDGPEKRNLQKLAEDLNISEHILFTGYISHDEMIQYYRSADVFILPSIEIGGYKEGLGVVIIEAMACGTPVIGTNIGGITDIIKDDYNGLLIAERSPDDIAKKAVKILTNKEYAEQLKQNALATVNSKYSWSRVVEAFSQIYSQL